MHSRFTPPLRQNRFPKKLRPIPLPFSSQPMSALEKLGGKIVMPKLTIPTVGTLIFFQDPEGNLAGAMQYEKSPA